MLLEQITATLLCAATAGIVRDNVVSTPNYLLHLPSTGHPLISDLSSCANLRCASSCGYGTCVDGWCQCGCGYVGSACDVQLTLTPLPTFSGTILTTMIYEYCLWIA